MCHSVTATKKGYTDNEIKPRETTFSPSDLQSRAERHHEVLMDLIEPFFQGKDVFEPRLVL